MTTTAETYTPRKSHEPYAKKNPNSLTFAALRGAAPNRRGSGGMSLSESRKILEFQKQGMSFEEAVKAVRGGVTNPQQETKKTSETPPRESRSEKQQAKKEPKRAVAEYGSADYIEGKDLIKIKPTASNFNQAITETSQPLKHEVMYVFDGKGNAIASWGGSGRQVQPDLKNMEYAATLHNHPRLYGSYGTFSPTDIASYLEIGKKLNHYVVTEKYVFKFNIGNMNMDYKNKLSLRVELNDKTDSLTAKMKKTIRQGDYSKESYMQAYKEWHKDRDNMMKELAQKYGFEYSSMTVEDFKKAHKI